MQYSYGTTGVGRGKDTRNLSDMGTYPLIALIPDVAVATASQRTNSG
jgi:hypothetical protein